jgi:hypothetical protein
VPAWALGVAISAKNCMRVTPEDGIVTGGPSMTPERGKSVALTLPVSVPW